MSHKNQIEIYQFNSRAKYWLVRAEGGKYYDDFKYNHFISIHHNRVTLADLQTTDLLLTTEKTIEHYKQQIIRVYEGEELSKHQITFTAKRLYSFVEDMSIGDYVVVPSFKSNYFLIGQITSDVYEKDLSDGQVTLNHGYEQSEDIKRRNVIWINEVPRRKVNSKFLYSTLTVHHTIFNITDLSRYIDGLVSPLYFKDGKLHLWLRVNTKGSITSSMWKNLYSIIDEYKNPEIDEEIIATSNVESPGEITLQSIGQFISDNHWMIESGLIGLSLLFGDVEVTGVKMKGLFPYLQQRKTARLEERKLTVEVETMEKDAKLKDVQRDVEIEKARKELESLRNVRAFEITVDSPSVSYENAPQTQMDSNENQDEG
ncbi:hypothetical protein HMPREF1125_1053 [Streptococcus oralis SK304]|uniref:Uncharacterized protein n=1 Tax=Streptococcus oralis SK304 TaxID=1161421 RepID=J4UDD0_STROR|nr:hypothetical protein [Streptococcus oralis]EJP21107.1 hypothetical protein HMPREF1125_1053 [Streptococcus oralis SK304]